MSYCADLCKSTRCQQTWPPVLSPPVDLMRGYSQLYDDALVLAARAHWTQNRKGRDVPYLVHPVHVSAILLRYGWSENAVVAGLLHDVVEDQQVSLALIEEAFGATVAEIVSALTEKKTEDGIKRRWETRKLEALEKLRHASRDAVAVRAADVLHNVRSLITDLRKQGPSVWNRFTRGPEPSMWYYRGVMQIIRERLGEHPLADEVDLAIDCLEKAVAASQDQ